MFLAEQVLHAQFIESLIIGLIMSVVSIAISELLKSKPKIENARPASDGDFDFPTSIENRVVPIVFGTVRLAGPNVMWWGDRSQRPIKETIKINLWSQKRVIVGWRYDVGIQFGLCRGPLENASDGLKRIWIGDDLVFTGNVKDGTLTIDEPELFGGDDFGQGGVEGTVRVHPGTETQGVNAYLTPHQSPQPAYRGTTYAVLEKGYIGNTTSVAPWSFELARFPNTLGLTSGREIVNGADANLAAVVYELLTNDEWGFGRPAADVDVANLITAGNTLHLEGNGFSFQMESQIPADEFQHEIERQMGGVVYLDQPSGKYKISLVRGGYDIASVPKIDENNTLSIDNHSQGSWSETTNQLRVEYSARDLEYKRTHAKADDLGNARIQKKTVSDTIKYPGCKNADLATALASRDLKEKSIPLSKANVEVDRSMWQLVLGDIVAWSSPTLGLVDVPMRVIRINRGTLVDSAMQLTLLQDVFEWDVGFFAAPPATLWVKPSEDVTAINTAEAVILEAPYAIGRRDPLELGAFNRLWAFARSPGGPEITFKMYQRNDPVTPAGAFALAGEVFGFMKIGELGTALSPGDAMPTVTIRLDVTPDVIADLLEGFVTATSGDVGSLTNLIMIGGEFLGVSSVVDQTTFVDLKNVYRGMMDTVPTTHAIDDDVFLVFQSAGLSDSLMPRGNVVDVQLRSRSRTDESTEGESTTVQLTMADRARRPYPPTELFLNATRYDPTVDFDDLKSGGSTLDERGIEATFTRRDWETENEVAGIETDAATLDADFPTKHSTQYKLSVFERAPSLLTGLEVFYNLDEASGDAIDAGPNGHNMTDNGTVDAFAGAGANTGTARDFAQGALEHFELADNADVSFVAEDFEITGFFRLKNVTGTKGIVAKWLFQGGEFIEYGVFTSGANLFFGVSDDGTDDVGHFGQVQNTLTLVASQWYWFSARHEDGVDVELEVVAISSPLSASTIDSVAHTVGCNDSTRPFHIGLIRGTVDEYHDGQSDATGLWRRLLTQVEREVLFNFNGGGNQIPFTGQLLGESTFNAGEADSFVSRTEILRTTDGRLPTDLTSRVTTQHDQISETFESLQNLEFDHTRVAGTLDNDTNFGVQDTNVVGTIASAPDTGTYTFTIGTAIPNGVVEAQINGGGYSTIIATSGTTGTLAGVTAGDTVDVRHTESVAVYETFLEVISPTSSVNAYGILVN